MTKDPRILLPGHTFVPPNRADLPKHYIEWPTGGGTASMRVFYEVQRPGAPGFRLPGQPPLASVGPGSVRLLFVPMHGQGYALAFDLADHMIVSDGLIDLGQRVKRL